MKKLVKQRKKRKNNCCPSLATAVVIQYCTRLFKMVGGFESLTSVQLRANIEIIEGVNSV